MHYFSRQLTVPKMLTTSLSTLISKLSSRKIIFLPTGDKLSPIIDKSSSKSLTSKSARFKSIIGSFYKSLLTDYKPTSLDEATDYGHQIIASDLEWWFHGPPGCDYMMRMLTGQSSQQFRFEPRNIEVVGDRVIVEGWEGEKVYWVHVWTVRDDDDDDSNDGAMVITQFREYFNTWLTVKDVTGGGRGRRIVNPASTEKEKLTLWRSQPGDVFERSLPGLVLAI
ncbi:Senescence associated gene 20 [Linum grandiflorum]